MPKASSRPSDTKPSLLAQVFKRKIVRRSVIVIGGLVLLVVLFYAEENIRGKLAWEKYKKEQEAKGEKFDWQSFIPPAVPDDENFAMTPFFGSLFDYDETKKSAIKHSDPAPKTEFNIKDVSSRVSGTWTKGQFLNFKPQVVTEKNKNDSPPAETTSERIADATDVLQLISKYQPILDELEKASHRPHARFNIHYEDESVVDILLPHLASLKGIAILFESKASAESALGHTEKALEDIRMILYLSSTLKKEPFLMSGLVRLALLQISLQPVWEGLAKHQWSDAQLIELQQQLGQIDLLEEYGVQLRGERALNLSGLEYLRLHGIKNESLDNGSQKSGRLSMPGGWIYQNEVAVGRMYKMGIFASVEAATHRVYPTLLSKNQKLLMDEFAGGLYPNKIFAAIMFPLVAKSQIKYAALQSKIDEALVACALERYRLANHEYPESLEALSPKFIGHLPVDMFNGDPLKYRRTDKDQFILYSIGWDEKDDGGVIAFKKDSDNVSIDLNSGDWVWPQYPQN